MRFAFWFLSNNYNWSLCIVPHIYMYSYMCDPLCQTRSYIYFFECHLMPTNYNYILINTPKVHNLLLCRETYVMMMIEIIVLATKCSFTVFLYHDDKILYFTLYFSPFRLFIYHPSALPSLKVISVLHHSGASYRCCQPQIMSFGRLSICNR